MLLLGAGEIPRGGRGAQERHLGGAPRPVSRWARG